MSEKRERGRLINSLHMTYVFIYSPSSRSHYQLLAVSSQNEVSFSCPAKLLSCRHKSEKEGLASPKELGFMSLSQLTSYKRTKYLIRNSREYKQCYSI